MENERQTYYRVSPKIRLGLILSCAPKHTLGFMFREYHPEKSARAYFPIRSCFRGNVVAFPKNSVTLSVMSLPSVLVRVLAQRLRECFLWMTVMPSERPFRDSRPGVHIPLAP